MILRSTFSKIGKILFLLKLITCPGIFINFALIFSPMPMDGGMKINILPYLTKAAVKYVKWAIIIRSSHVINKVFHLQLHTVSMIVFPTFEFLVSIFFA